MSVKCQGEKVVYCRFIIKNGRRIYPTKAKFFRFVVRDKVA